MANVIHRARRFLHKYGFKKTVKRAYLRLTERFDPNAGYRMYLAGHSLTDEDLEQQKKTTFSYAPKISIAVPLYRTVPKFLREMIASVEEQTYPNWELVLCDGSPAKGEEGWKSGDKDLSVLVEKAAKGDSRVRYIRLEKNLGIAGNTNAAFEAATGDFIGLLDHDDTLTPDALFSVVRELNRALTAEEDENSPFAPAPWGRSERPSEQVSTKKSMSDAAVKQIVEPTKETAGETTISPAEDPAQRKVIIYSDEDKLNSARGTYFTPHFKSDWNPDLFTSNNYITHFFVFSRAVYETVGGELPDFDGAQDYDFILRCAESAEEILHVKRVLYHWRSYSQSTSKKAAAKPYAVDSGKRALEAHFKRLGMNVEVKDDFLPGYYDVQYLDEVPGTIEVIRGKEPADLNAAAKKSGDDFLLFLAEDVTEEKREEAADRMKSFFTRPDVGIVGGRTVFWSGFIRDMGYILSNEIPGVEPFFWLNIDQYGYFFRSQSTQDLSAVSKGAMMVRRSDFLALGGFDESLPLYFDIDFCLKLQRKLQKLVVYDPKSQFNLKTPTGEKKSLKEEEAEQAEFEKGMRKELAVFIERYPQEYTTCDEFYNPNLSLDCRFSAGAGEKS